MHLKCKEIQEVALLPQSQRNSVLNNKKEFPLSLGSHIIIGFQLISEPQEGPISGAMHSGHSFGLNSELGSRGVRNILNIYTCFSFSYLRTPSSWNVLFLDWHNCSVGAIWVSQVNKKLLKCVLWEFPLVTWLAFIFRIIIICCVLLSLKTHSNLICKLRDCDSFFFFFLAVLG